MASDAYFHDEPQGAEPAREKTPRQRWGTCCPFDPECEHSFLDLDDLRRWMDTPISDAQAAEVVA